MILIITGTTVANKTLKNIVTFKSLGSVRCF